MAKEVVGGVSSSMLGMLADLFLKLKSGAITERELERFTNRQNPFEIVENLLAEWQRFYAKVFGIQISQVDLSGIRIPIERQGFGWLVVMLQGMTARRLFDKCRERFGTWRYNEGEDLDKVVKSDRTAKDCPYAVWFRDRVEADEELKSKSADNLKQAGVQGITLEERLLLELFYYWKTGKHLDLKNVTLCSGSRHSDGCVPGVCWVGYCDRLSVCWYDPVDAVGSIRSRQAVS